MKNILIGVTGSIAAYKACELVRLLVKAEFSVKVVMTENAKKFIHPNTFEALSANPVYCDMFENSMQHIELAKWADSIIIAPATASTISKLASGSAECLLTTLCLASQAICFIAPAMNKVMFQNPATIKNMAQLKLNGFRIIASNYGQQACGDIGLGRMTEPENIFNTIMQRSSLFKGIKLIVTAGPTHEKIDPVRYVSNFSSGKMGYALAKAAYEYGASVCLISGPTNLLPPHGCQVIYVQSAEDMLNAVMKEALNTSILISSAAIADYRPQAFSKSKLKKEEESLTIKFSKTVDILTQVSQCYPHIFNVGFAAETENVIEYAKSKLMNKKLDAIIANKIISDGYPFNSETNKLTYISKNQFVAFEKNSKLNLARSLIELIYKSYINNKKTYLRKYDG